MMRSLVSMLCVLGSLSGCNSSNNVVLGRVEAAVGGHQVVVTDCYRTSAPVPEEGKNSVDGKPEYRFTPCRDAVIVIHDELLTVNGAQYGRLKAGDTVVVDHGKVLINNRDAVVSG